MEETKEITYEQLEEAARQLQQRVFMLETKLNSIEMVSMRIGWLFNVVEKRNAFSKEFVEKCVNELETILTIENKENGED